MNITYCILTDDLMEQIELQNIVGISHSRIITNLESLESACNSNQEYIFLINLHAWNLDPILTITYLKENNKNPNAIVIAFTNEKHDHESIHRAKTAGAKLVVEKDRLTPFLQSISTTV